MPRSAHHVEHDREPADSDVEASASVSGVKSASWITIWPPGAVGSTNRVHASCGFGRSSSSIRATTRSKLDRSRSSRPKSPLRTSTTSPASGSTQCVSRSTATTIRQRRHGPPPRDATAPGRRPRASASRWIRRWPRALRSSARRGRRTTGHPPPLGVVRIGRADVVGHGPSLISEAAGRVGTTIRAVAQPAPRHVGDLLRRCAGRSHVAYRRHTHRSLRTRPADAPRS